MSWGASVNSSDVLSKQRGQATHQEGEYFSEAVLKALEPAPPKAKQKDLSSYDSFRSPRGYARAIDAVKDAKRELSQPRGLPKISKKDVSAPPEAFHNFSNSVLAPSVSIRHRANQLLDTFDTQHRAHKAACARDLDLGSLDLDVTNSKAPLDAHAEMEQTQKEINICKQIMEEFAKDLAVECKERGDLFERLHVAMSEALGRLCNLVKTCTDGVEQAEKGKQEAQNTLAQLECENEENQKKIQSLLVTEAELRTRANYLQNQVDNFEKKLAEANEQGAQLAASRDAAEEALERMRQGLDEKTLTRDSCNSPMMGFQAFMMVPEDAPPPQSLTFITTAADEEARGFAGSHVGSMSSLAGISGAGRGPGESEEANERRGSGLSSSQGRASSQLKRDHRRPSREPPQSKSPVSRQETDDVTSSRPEGDEDGFGPPAQRQSQMKETSESLELASPAAVVPVLCAPEYSAAMSPVSTSFPALVPFLNFGQLDMAWEHARDPDLAVTKEHLEKHLVECQQDYKQELSKNEKTQQAVDVFLKRFLVWTRSVYDSLQGLSSNLVQQEFNALEVLCEVVKWLATRACHEWVSPEGHFETVLDSYEKKINAFLEMDRQRDLDADDLRRRLASANCRIEELQDEMGQLKLASQAAPAAKSVRRAGPSKPQVGGDEPVVVHHVGCQVGGKRESQPTGSPSKSAAQGGSRGVRRPGQEEEMAAEDAASSQAIADGSRSARFSMLDEGLCDEGGAGDSRPAADANAEGEALGEGEATFQTAVGAQSDEVKRMQLLSCKFVADIDFTAIPLSSRPILGMPPKGIAAHIEKTDAPGEDAKPLGLKQLHAVIREAYDHKRKDDEMQDKAHQPRKALHVVLQDLIKRKHGVRHVVQQKSWQLAESLLQHHKEDKTTRIFSDFLDCSRDGDELSFYLYCNAVVVHTVHEEPSASTGTVQAQGQKRISLMRAHQTADRIFGDLPKTHAVLKMEIEKSAQVDEDYFMGGFGVSPDLMQYFDFGAGLGGGEQKKSIDAEELYELLLEGWRMSSLLLDQDKSRVSWRQSVLAFVRSDKHKRGWLNAIEVADCEKTWLQILPDPRAPEVPIPERTSLGGFVYRLMQLGQTAGDIGSPRKKKFLGSHLKKERENCLKVAKNAFHSIEKPLAVYLTGLMHSEELKDVALYRSLKLWLFDFRKAMSSDDPAGSVHYLRNLLLLLLAHQVDFQSAQGMMQAERLDYEFRMLLTVLQDNWKAQKGEDEEDEEEGELEEDEPPGDYGEDY
eukprot:gnl/MRDRNA2_/MRDRNA2_98705_c0_seq1.p1 gnl/MRDRNA2_/MRDRNA2_98705_c0~~gnl/MRDRNA2_/MRDRNA2_98705_c0_seq1.p1  ORF type:complete len:1261 (-),score=341.43 gnl/MRDRNA2_/MRDRNA2_98705_c0_seq1:42-3824(-)